MKDQEIYSAALDFLTESVRGRLDHDLIMIDFLPFKDDILNFARDFKEICMPSEAKNDARSIMTPFSDLLTVTPDSLFSELYFRMVTMGFRHIPVIDSEESKKYLRVISRRDLVDKVPPGGAFLPEDVQSDCGINLDRRQLKQELKNLGKKKVKELFAEPQNLDIHVLPDDSIEKVIATFSRKQQLGERKGYVSAMPVLDKEGKLEGFISYTDVFERFLSSQTDFLKSEQATASRMATISDLETLSESDKLRDALLMFSTTGFRAFPVIKDGTEDVLVGYLEDIQVKFFNYKKKDFAAQLGNLGVEYMMIKSDRLYTPLPEQELSDFISQFWQPLNGSAPAPSFAVCQIEKDGTKKLVGILSYVDVLNKWQEWNQGPKR